MSVTEERFWIHVDKSGDCWEWQGYRTPKGYGTLTIQRRTVRAHRFAYELTNGPVPKGRIVCHRCDNPPCVRPEHLYAGTFSDNQFDRHKNSDRIKLSPAEKTRAYKASLGVKCVVCGASRHPNSKAFCRACYRNAVRSRSWEKGNA